MTSQGLEQSLESRDGLVIEEVGVVTHIGHGSPGARPPSVRPEPCASPMA